MTNWVTIRVPEPDRDAAKEMRPDDATHGDCLVAGSQALNAAAQEGFSDDVVGYLQYMEDQAAGVYENDSDTAGIDNVVEELKSELSMVADPTVSPDMESLFEKLETVEAAAKEATQAAQSAEQSVEELQR